MQSVQDLDNLTASLDIQRIHLSALRLNPNNTQTNHRISELMQSLESYGQFKPLVVWRGMVICGNGTFQAAKKLGWRYIQCNVLPDDTPEETVKAIGLIDNRSFSDPDEEQIALILQDLQDMDLPTGYADDEIKALLATLEPPQESKDSPPQSNKAEELREEWGTQVGQLWRLPARDGKGEHRLIVGDCTDKAVVDRLMGGDRVDMCFTSPPYNAGNTTTGAYKQGSAKRTDFKKMYHDSTDNLPHDDYKAFLLSVLCIISKIAKVESPTLWNVCYNANSRRLYGQVVFSDDNPIPVQESIVWDKGLGMNISGNNILSRSCEFVYLLSKTNKYTSNQNGGVYWNVWRVSNRDGENMSMHGASFPVDLPMTGIKQFSSQGSIVYEPFAGSGTTIIAAENLNRYSRAVEISEAYCAVILQRYYDTFQIKGELIT